MSLVLWARLQAQRWGLPVGKAGDRVLAPIHAAGWQPIPPLRQCHCMDTARAHSPGPYPKRGSMLALSRQDLGIAERNQR